jgi:hypothetical protein
MNNLRIISDHTFNQSLGYALEQHQRFCGGKIPVALKSNNWKKLFKRNVRNLKNVQTDDAEGLDHAIYLNEYARNLLHYHKFNSEKMNSVRHTFPEKLIKRE